MVKTDISDGVIGGILSQQNPSIELWHPIVYFSKTIQATKLNYDIHDKELLAIVLVVKEWRAWLEGLQTSDPFRLYSNHRSLEYFMITKKLSAQQAQWAELLSQYHFKLQYHTGKANERANALSQKSKDVKEQQKAKDQYRTQVLLPYNKIDQVVLNDLKLSDITSAISTELLPMELAIEETTITTATAQRSESDLGYNSLQLTDRILNDNRTNPELEDLRTKAAKEGEDTWSLRDGLLLQYGKLYVTEGIIHEMPLRTAIIREAYDQPLTGHPGRAKL